MVVSGGWVGLRQSDVACHVPTAFTALERQPISWLAAICGGRGMPRPYCKLSTNNINVWKTRKAKQLALFSLFAVSG